MYASVVKIKSDPTSECLFKKRFSSETLFSNLEPRPDHTTRSGNCHRKVIDLYSDTIFKCATTKFLETLEISILSGHLICRRQNF